MKILTTQNLSKFLLTALITFLIAACTRTPNTRPPTDLVAKIPAENLEQVWQVQLGKMNEADGRGLGITQGEQQIFVASISGRLAALSTEPKGVSSDQVLWQIQMEPNLNAGPTYAEGNLYLGTSKGSVIALDATTGNQIWLRELNSEIVSQPVVAEHKVLVRTSDGRLVALNEFSGEVVWTAEQQMPNLFLRGAAPVLAYQDLVIIGRETGLVEALDLATGTKIWDYRVATPKGRTDLERMVDVQAKLVEDSGRIYVLAYNGQLAALNGRNGNLLWNKDVSGYRDMLLDRGALYVIDKDDILSAYDGSTGAKYWQQDNLKYRQTSSVQADQNNSNELLVVDGFGFVHWLDARDGGFLARYKHTNHVETGEKVVDWMQLDGLHYVLDTDGFVTAYRAEQNIDHLFPPK